MRNSILPSLLVPVLLFMLVACGERKKSERSSSERGDEEQENVSSPSRQQMIDDLKSVYRSIESGNMQRASYYLQIPPDASESQIEEELNGLLEKNELSPEGISILSKRGEFGKLKEIFPEKAERWLDRANISSARNCYAFGYLNAEVAGRWVDDHFVFFRLDDVGKLASSEEDY